MATPFPLLKLVGRSIVQAGSAARSGAVDAAFADIAADVAAPWVAAHTEAERRAEVQRLRPGDASPFGESPRADPLGEVVGALAALVVELGADCPPRLGEALTAFLGNVALTIGDALRLSETWMDHPKAQAAAALIAGRAEALHLFLLGGLPLLPALEEHLGLVPPRSDLGAYRKPVGAAAFLPDGLHVLTGGWDGTLRLWELATGREVCRFEGHAGSVLCVAVSPDGRRALSGGMRYSLMRGYTTVWDSAGAHVFEHDELPPPDATLRLWDLETGQEVGRFDTVLDSVLSVAFAPDGRRALVGTGTFLGGQTGLEPEAGAEDCSLRLWDLVDGRQLARLEGHTAAVMAVAFAPDGCRGLSGSLDGTARLWDLASGTALRQFDLGEGGRITTVSFSPDGEQVLLGGGGPGGTALALCAVATGAPLQRVALPGEVITQGAFAPDSLHVLAGTLSGTLHVLEAADWRASKVFHQPGTQVLTVAFSPDGRQALTAGEGLRLWDLDAAPEVRCLASLLHPIRSLAFSPDGRQILCGSDDALVRLLDAASGEELACFEGHAGNVLGVAFAADGRRAVSCGDTSTRLWDLEGGGLLQTMPGPTAVLCVALSPDGCRALSGEFHEAEEAAVRLWDAASGQEVRRLQGSEASVWSVAISTDGRRGLSGGEDARVRLWDLDTGTPLLELPGHCAQVTSVGFAVDSRRAFSGSAMDGTVIVWDLETGKALQQFTVGPSAGALLARFNPMGYSERGDEVAHVAFSQDGGRCLLGQLDGTLRLWDVEAGKELRRLQAPQGWMKLALAPDGRHALCGGEDGKLWLWEVLSQVGQGPVPT